MKGERGGRRIIWKRGEGRERRYGGREKRERERGERKKGGREKRERGKRGGVCVWVCGCVGGGGGEEKKKMHFVPFIFTCAAYILTTHTYFPPFLSHLCN